MVDMRGVTKSRLGPPVSDHVHPELWRIPVPKDADEEYRV